MKLNKYLNQLKEVPDTDYMESVLDPVRDKLCGKMFNGMELKPSIAKYITGEFERWLKAANAVRDEEIEVKAMTIVGSSLGYQYTAKSDVDVHVLLKGIAPKEVDALAETLPKRKDIPGTEHPLEFYLTKDMKDVKNADTAYDLLERKWLKKPEHKDIKIPYSYAVEIAKLFMAGVDNRIMEYESDVNEKKHYEKLLETVPTGEHDELKVAIAAKEAEIAADLDAIHVGRHLATAFRKEAFSDEHQMSFLIEIKGSGSPNYSVNNIVFKILQDWGFFDRLDKYEELRKKLKGQK